MGDQASKRSVIILGALVGIGWVLAIVAVMRTAGVF